MIQTAEKKAIETLVAFLDSQNEGTRLQAAQTILQHVQTCLYFPKPKEDS